MFNHDEKNAYRACGFSTIDHVGARFDELVENIHNKRFDDITEEQVRAAAMLWAMTISEYGPDNDFIGAVIVSLFTHHLNRVSEVAEVVYERLVHLREDDTKVFAITVAALSYAVSKRILSELAK